MITDHECWHGKLALTDSCPLTAFNSSSSTLDSNDLLSFIDDGLIFSSDGVASSKQQHKTNNSSSSMACLGGGGCDGLLTTTTEVGVPCSVNGTAFTNGCANVTSSAFALSTSPKADVVVGDNTCSNGGNDSTSSTSTPSIDASTVVSKIGFVAILATMCYFLVCECCCRNLVVKWPQSPAAELSQKKNKHEDIHTLQSKGPGATARNLLGLFCSSKDNYGHVDKDANQVSKDEATTDGCYRHTKGTMKTARQFRENPAVLLRLLLFVAAAGAAWFYLVGSSNSRQVPPLTVADSLDSECIDASVDVIVNVYTDSLDGECIDASSQKCNLRAAVVANACRSGGRILMPSQEVHKLDQAFGQLADITGSMAMVNDGSDDADDDEEEGGRQVIIDGGGNKGRFASLHEGSLLKVGNRFTFRNFEVGEGVRNRTTADSGDEDNGGGSNGSDDAVKTVGTQYWTVVGVVLCACLCYSGCGGRLQWAAVAAVARGRRKGYRMIIACVFTVALVVAVSCWVTPGVLAASGGYMDVGSGSFTAPADTTYAEYTVTNDGGVFDVDGGTLIIGEGCVFENNAASYGGGAINVDGGGDVEIGDSVEFNDNTAYVSASSFI